jgi:hypothetical protein
MKINVSKNYNYDELRKSAKQTIDMMAEQFRAQNVGVSAAQTVVYQSKLEEAKRVLAGDDTDCPLLSVEVGITAPTLEKVADLVILKDAVWKRTVGQIETVRLSRKRMIDAAPDNVFEIEKIVKNTSFS